MSYNGTEGSAISLATGSNMTSNYRKNNPDAILGHFFGSDLLRQILDQDGCKGIRMYYAEDDDGNKELVIVGADADENDMLDLIGDVSHQCPPCGTPNSLNS
jgi:hypothetical protein